MEEVIEFINVRYDGIWTKPLQRVWQYLCTHQEMTMKGKRESMITLLYNELTSPATGEPEHLVIERFELMRSRELFERNQAMLKLEALIKEIWKR